MKTWLIIKVDKEEYDKELCRDPLLPPHEILRIYVEDDTFKDDETWKYLYKEKKKAESKLIEYEQKIRHK